MRIEVRHDDIAFYNHDLSRTVHAGTYTLHLGAHELDAKALVGNVTL